MAIDNIIPLFTQDRDPTCELASLVSAMILHDRLAGTKDNNFASACKTASLYCDKNRSTIIQKAGVTEVNEFDKILQVVKDFSIVKKNDLITQSTYRGLCDALYFIRLTEESNVLRQGAKETFRSILERIGLKIIKSISQHQTLGDIFKDNALVNIKSGGIAQIIWAVTQPTNDPGFVWRSYHAFLISRMLADKWILLDTAFFPAKVIEGSNRINLLKNILDEIKAHTYWLFLREIQNSDKIFTGIRFLNL